MLISEQRAMLDTQCEVNGPLHSSCHSQVWWCQWAMCDSLHRFLHPLHGSPCTCMHTTVEMWHSAEMFLSQNEQSVNAMYQLTDSHHVCCCGQVFSHLFYAHMSNRCLALLSIVVHGGLCHTVTFFKIHHHSLYRLEIWQTDRMW